MDSRSNRRKSIRYASISNRACFAWRVADETTQVAARVWDISQSGASILIEKQPPVQATEPAWLRLEEPAPSDWAEVTVIGVTPLKKKGLWRRGEILGHLVRVQFDGVCPYDLFKTAVHGKPVDANIDDAGPGADEGVIWR